LGREEGDWGRNVFGGVYLWELGGRRWRGKKDGGDVGEENVGDGVEH
jgi:hypothetical protein